MIYLLLVFDAVMHSSIVVLMGRSVDSLEDEALDVTPSLSMEFFDVIDPYLDLFVLSLACEIGKCYS